MMYKHFFTFYNTYIYETNDPIEYIWDYFRKISDIPFLNNKWPESSNENRIKISTYIKQAYEYKIASQNVSLLIKPVLTYYSLHNLTKAVLILRGIDVNTNYHGLSKCQPNEILIEGNVLTNDGVFRGLCKAFGHEYQNGEILTIKNLLANTVEGNIFLIEYFSQQTNFLKINWNGTFDGHIKIDLINWKNLALNYEELESNIKENSKILDEFDLKIESDFAFIITKEKYERIDFDKVANELSEKYFTQTVFDQSPDWIKLIPDRIKYHPAISYYALLFILSSYSRYHPEWLNKNIRNLDTGYEFMFDKLIIYSERIFPNLCMNLIRQINCVLK